MSRPGHGAKRPGRRLKETAKRLEATAKRLCPRGRDRNECIASRLRVMLTKLRR